MPGHVELSHPLLGDTTVIVDAGAVSHHAMSGWQARGPAILLPVKTRRFSPVIPRLVRIYNPVLGTGNEVPEGALPHMRRGGWILAAEWDTNQAAEAAAKAAEALETRAVPVTAAPHAPVPAAQNIQEK
jgi:hypothetical protein